MVEPQMYELTGEESPHFALIDFVMHQSEVVDGTVRQQAGQAD